MDIGLEKSRVVWKDLRSRRIGKSLEMKLGLEVMSRNKNSSWCTHGIHIYDGD